MKVTGPPLTAGALMDVDGGSVVVDLTEAAAATIAAGDFLPFLDGGTTGTQSKGSINDVATLFAGTASATGLSASSGVLSVTDLTALGVSGSANQMLTDDGDGTVTSQTALMFDGTNLEIEGSSGDLSIELDNNASNSANFQIQNGAGNARADLVLDGNTHITMKGQRVGILDTDPSHTLTVTGNAQITTDLTIGGDLTLDDGGSIKEAGGTAAITIDSDGEVSKIGQDSPSDADVLTWDNTNSKVVWSAASGGVSLANDGDNRIVTATGSDGLNGEANLSFDGSTLAVTGALTTTTTATIGTDLTVTGDIIIDDGGSIKEAGGTAAITIDASGEVTKIGQDTPSDAQVLTWDNTNSKVVWSAASGGGAASNDADLIIHMQEFA